MLPPVLILQESRILSGSIFGGQAKMCIKGMDPETNPSHICGMIRKAMDEEKAYLIVFPELAESGTPKYK